MLQAHQPQREDSPLAHQDRGQPGTASTVPATGTVYDSTPYNWLTDRKEKILHWLTGTEGSQVQPVQFLPQVWDCTVLYIWLTDHREKILHWLTGTEASPVQPVQLLPQVYDSLYCTQVAHPPQGEDPPLAHGDREQPGTASTVNFLSFPLSLVLSRRLTGKKNLYAK